MPTYAGARVVTSYKHNAGLTLMRQRQNSSAHKRLLAGSADYGLCRLVHFGLTFWAFGSFIGIPLSLLGSFGTLEDTISETNQSSGILRGWTNVTHIIWLMEGVLQGYSIETHEGKRLATWEETWYWCLRKMQIDRVQLGFNAARLV